ncbi:hypothetical protein GEMRC1_008349 [Eukaryota sp. GEM-RC1]
MAIGKSKRTGGKKGSRKRCMSILFLSHVSVDAFAKKEWYDIRAPAMFTQREVGKTVATKTAGLKLSSDSLKGRVVQAFVADLNTNDDQFRKIKLRIEDVSGKLCLTNFHGMDFTTDRLRSLIKKWQTLIEAHIDVRTTDGYLLRLFCIGFTTRQKEQVKKTCYAQSSQIRRIRAKMFAIMKKEATTDLKTFVSKLLSEKIGNEIAKACHNIYPLRDVYIRKVKVVRAPKFDAARLMELHTKPVETGAPVADAVEETKE